jgi:hypothetical protein
MPNIDPKLNEKYQAMVESLKNSGKVTNKITVREALTTNDMNILMPKTIETIMLDAAEPEYLASQFLRTINLGEGRSMEFINFGAIRAFEISEGGEYPEQSLDVAKMGGKLTTEVKVKKYGLKVKITDEMINDSQWDVIGMHLQAAGRALARKKEENVFLEFSRHGHVVFDADLGGTWSGGTVGNGTYSPNETGLAPTGRGFDGNLNATLTVQDFIDMCTSIMAAGFTPTDVIMHPLCYSIFVANENLMSLFAGPATYGAPAFGGGVQGQAAIPQIPANRSYQLPVAGLQLHFSPYVPFDEVDKKFDLYILDRNNCGVMLVKEAMSVEQFDDPARDIQALKVKERYGVGTLNGGLGIAVAKNIRFAKTWPMPGREFAAMPMPSDMTNTTMDAVPNPRV